MDRISRENMTTVDISNALSKVIKKYMSQKRRCVRCDKEISQTTYSLYYCKCPECSSQHIKEILKKI